jgi:tRNA(fMet)-specific endonuclease VapC
MAARYLLDTNTASYVIKGTAPHLRERLLRVPTSNVAISSVTEAELRFGVQRVPVPTRLKAAVEEFLRFIDIKAWDSEAAQSYAEIRASVEAQGHPMGNLDLMIAAHASALGCVLVTSDRVFRWVTVLNTEDWAR